VTLITSKTLQGHRTKLIRKEKQTKRQNRRQSVVADIQQLYCAVQSRSPSHCQTTTGKVAYSLQLATERRQRRCIPDRRRTAGCSTHVPKPLGRHGHRVLNVWWTVPRAWLSQQSADDVVCYNVDELRSRYDAKLQYVFLIFSSGVFLQKCQNWA